MMPLADRIRPYSIDEFYGQEHLMGKNKVLRRIMESGNIPNMIFYGPPGVGKTTVANIIAEKSQKKIYKLNASNCSTKDIEKVVKELNSFMGYKGVILYLDEIQNFNKKQQQSLLEYIEDGRITLISSTTENPYFSIYKAILSRSIIFEFKPLQKEDIINGLNRAVNLIKNEDEKFDVTEEALNYISEISSGDMRKSLNILETSYNFKGRGNVVEPEDVEALYQSNMRFDPSGDEHYNILSFLQKSIRGSDENAAIHALARLVKGGDLTSICRRLLVIAAEDIGMAHPQAISVVHSCTSAAKEVGFPEARIILAQAVIYLATLPKSNSAYLAIDSAINDLNTKDCGDIPVYLKDSHYGGAKKLGVKGYKYPHNYENHYVKQQYLPDDIKDTRYYMSQNNKYENALKTYWDKVKK
ncbi:replication-associated recombination protein A [Oceanirhabdus seepicola]|uniref:Replication-associated recombination protein A n=1 Tax=Oceanirhabdus seepicola TaxID=2828781 RepID=A0A9J6P3C6_9CLOT|nr:replication-associated recombination protein A [Oceanirhabdus seepicola]